MRRLLWLVPLALWAQDRNLVSNWYTPALQAVYLNPDDAILGCMKADHAVVNTAAHQLQITADHTTNTCSDRNLDGTARSGPFTLNYTSAQIQSNFTFTYGTVEYSATHPVKGGQWSIVWLMGSTSSSANPGCQATFKFTTDVPFSGCQWDTPPSDEIDMSEYLATNAYHPQVHSSAGSTTCSTITTESTPTKHVYKMVWSAGSLVFSLDGTSKCTLSGAGVPSTPMFIIVTYLVSNNSGLGTPNTADFPSVFSVDYLKVTQAGVIVFDDEFNGAYAHVGF